MGVVELQELKSLLDSAELTPVSAYMEVAVIEINGTKYRKVVQYAGLGRHRRQLPPRYEIYDEEKDRWYRFRFPEKM